MVQVHISVASSPVFLSRSSTLHVHYEGPIAQKIPLSIKRMYPLILECPRKHMVPLSRCLVPGVPLSHPRCPVVFQPKDFFLSLDLFIGMRWILQVVYLNF
jgi:hypothetical protein